MVVQGGGDEFRRLLLNPARRLPNNLNVAYNSVLNLLVLLERLNAVETLHISGSSLNGLRDVLQIVFDTLWMLHKGSACCNTRSRNFTDRNSGVSTVTGTPSNCCAACSSPASVNKVVVFVASTNKSRSLSSVSVPLKTDPKTRGCDRP